MKALRFCLLGLLIFTIHGFAEDDIERLKKNPGSYLNLQDVPFFFNGNPLEGLDAFAVIPPYTIQSAEVNRNIEKIIEKELSSIGNVIKTKCEDTRGIGTGNLLTILIGRVTKWDGSELPFFRVSLNVETSVVISKTNVKSMPRLWTINDFVDSPLKVKSEKKAVSAVQNLLRAFIQNYKFVNANQEKKPTFYLYF